MVVKDCTCTVAIIALFVFVLNSKLHYSSGQMDPARLSRKDQSVGYAKEGLYGNAVACFIHCSVTGFLLEISVLGVAQLYFSKSEYWMAKS